VQTDIDERVADALELHLLPSEKSSIGQKSTEGMEAYRLYLKGRELWNKRTGLDVVNRAVECFNWAIEIDPHFAPAFVGIADCYMLLMNTS
jgi:adenylate cyclase